MALTLTERLAEAEGAYHDLQMGKSVVELQDQNGERVRYFPTSAARLSTYIAALRAEIAALANPNGAVTGPMRVHF